MRVPEAWTSRRSKWITAGCTQGVVNTAYPSREQAPNTTRNRPRRWPTSTGLPLGLGGMAMEGRDCLVPANIPDPYLALIRARRRPAAFIPNSRSKPPWRIIPQFVNVGVLKAELAPPPMIPPAIMQETHTSVVAAGGGMVPLPIEFTSTTAKEADSPWVPGGQ